MLHLLGTTLLLSMAGLHQPVENVPHPPRHPAPVVRALTDPTDRQQDGSGGVPRAATLLVAGSVLLLIAASSRRLRRLLPAARG